MRCMLEPWLFQRAYRFMCVAFKPSSSVSQKVRSLLLCPRGPCRWCGGWRARFPGVSHWPPQRWLRWLNRSPSAFRRQVTSCPWCRPVSRSWRRGGRRRHRTSKRGGSKREPGSHTFPWSSTDWCEWRPGQTVSVKWQERITEYLHWCWL